MDPKSRSIDSSSKAKGVLGFSYIGPLYFITKGPVVLIWADAYFRPYDSISRLGLGVSVADNCLSYFCFPDHSLSFFFFSSLSFLRTPTILKPVNSVDGDRIV